MLRRPLGTHLRHGDGPFKRPRHELDPLRPGPLPHDLQLRRPFRREAGTRGQPVHGRGLVLGHPRRPARAPDGCRGRLRIPGHHRILPRRRQIPPGRASQMQLEHGARRDPGAQGIVPGVRQARHPGRAAPRAGPGRPRRARPAAGPARLPFADSPARGALRGAGRGRGQQGRHRRVLPPAGTPGAGAVHPARGPAGRHFPRGARAGRGRGAHARGQGPAQFRL